MTFDHHQFEGRLKDIMRQLILSGNQDLATRLCVSLTLAQEPESLSGNLLLALSDVEDIYTDSDLNVREDVIAAREYAERFFENIGRGSALAGSMESLRLGAIPDAAGPNSLIKAIVVRLEYAGYLDLEFGLFTAWRYTHSAGEFYGELKLALINIQKTQAVEDVEIEQAVTNALEFVTSTLDIMNGNNLSTSPSA